MRRLAILLPVGFVVFASAAAGPLDADTQEVSVLKHTAVPVLVQTGHAPPLETTLTNPPGENAGAVSSSSLHWYGFYDAATRSAVEGGTWTFDHGAADPFEGWTMFRMFEDPLPWRRIDAAAWSGHDNLPAAPVISGSASMWLGYFEDEACLRGYAGGLGYGNAWHFELRSPPLAAPGGTAVTVSFDCFYDMEPGYDSLMVYVEQGGSRTPLDAFSGKSGSPASPLHKSYGLVVPTSEAFRILLEFHSDDTFSDEDSLYVTTLGPFGFDNLDVQGTGVTGEVPPPYDFETGLQGFTVTTPYTNEAGVNDISAYGAVPDCGAMSGNVLEFHDALMQHPFGQLDVLESNPVPLPQTLGPLNIFADFDVYGETGNGVVGYNTAWSYYPYECPITGEVTWSRPYGLLNNYVEASGCLHRRTFATDTLRYADAGGNVIPDGADSVRFYLRVANFISKPVADEPWPVFDAVRVGVSARNTVLHVPSPTYATIQMAIDAADPGDTVMVAPGTYRGVGNRDLHFGGKNVVLLGEEGSQATIVDCEHAARGIVFDAGEGPASVVSGIRFRNGDASGVGGGAIRVSLSSPTFVDCVAESSTTAGLPGGGVYVNGNATFFECHFEQNHTPDAGGGIFVAGGSPHFEDCVVNGNGCDGAGGGAMIAAGSPAFLNCQIEGNLSHSSGGGVAVLAGNPSFEGCTFDQNSADLNGGGAVVTGGSPSFLQCFLNQNDATLGGGLQTSSFGAPFLTECTISLNTAWQDGGGVHVVDGAPTFQSCGIEDNQANADGGGAYLQAGTPLWLDCTLDQNVASGSGGGLTVAAGTPYLESCWIAGNTGVEGGGMFLQPDASPSLTSCLISGNFASNDGGGAFIGIGLGVAPEFTSCTIARNRCSSGGGGGLYVENTSGGSDVMSVTQTIVEGNCSPGADDLSLVTGNSSSGVTFACSAIDPAGIVSNGTIVFVGGHVTTDPQFCDPGNCAAAPALAGDYTLSSDSPCTSANSPCGVQIGARDVGCSALDAGDHARPAPAATRLLPNAPNPFRVSTAIRFDLAEPGPVRLGVYDLSGRLLRTLADGWFPAARHTIAWDGRDAGGRPVAGGICFVRFDAGHRSFTRKLLLVR